jgi:hypothetical protein
LNMFAISTGLYQLRFSTNGCLGRCLLSELRAVKNNSMSNSVWFLKKRGNYMISFVEVRVGYGKPIFSMSNYARGF